jgi:GPH family glycoside/pentoside/hexuronide:cation symporter
VTSPREALSVWTKAVYGAPSFAGAAVAIPILIHMPKFYSDVVLVPVGWIGMAIAIARALDAITDPAIGWLSDRTESRLGRRRPWIALGAPLCALALVALFSPPTELTPSQAGAWFTATFALYFLFHAIYEIPYQGLGFELTPDYHERSSLFAWRMAFIIVGTLVASAAPGVLAGLGVADPRAQMRIIALAFGGALVAFFGLLVATVGERRESERTHVTNPLVPGVRRALRNRPFRILFLTFVIGSLPAAIPALMVPFYTSYVIRPENPEQTLALFLLLYFASGFLFLPLWLWAARRFGKLQAWLASFGVGISAGIGLYLCGEGDVLAVALLHVWAGLAFGAGGLLVPSMQADVVDYDELHTGKRREAQFAAFWAIVPKLVAIPGAALPIAALAAIGYVPNQVQTPEVQLGIRVIYALTPAAFGLASYFLARLYPISEAVHAEIKLGLAAHARGESARDPLSGEALAPPASRAIDEATGWLLDYFSPRELARLGGGDATGLVRSVVAKLALSGALTVAFFAVAIRGLESLDTEPGLAPTLCVVFGGFALTGACFHALRLRRAREMAGAPVAPEIVRAHLAGIASSEASLRRAA